jgi:hypothetical protein
MSNATLTIAKRQLIARQIRRADCRGVMKDRDLVFVDSKRVSAVAGVIKPGGARSFGKNYRRCREKK